MKQWTSKEIATACGKGHHRVVEKIKYYIAREDAFRRLVKEGGDDGSPYVLPRGAVIYIVKRFEKVEKEWWDNLGIKFTLEDHLRN